MRKVLRRRYAYVAAAVVVALVIALAWPGGAKRTTLTLSRFEADLAVPHRVVSAKVDDSTNEITGVLSDGTRYEVAYPARTIDTLTTKMLGAGVDVSATHSGQSIWASIFLDWGPVIAIAALFLFALYALQGGGSRVMQFGRARTKAAGKDKEQPRVTFADVAGADEAVAELQEIKEFLETPAKFQALGARIPRGVLLFGPPGTGKTLLAKAVAGEAGVPFFSISGSDFVEMFVGVGASRVRDLFEQAKANAPSIVFVDEIDAVGRHRGSGLGGGHDEREQTLNQLLVEMDGFDSRSGVILIAATNRPDILDPALLRPGRFDRQIAVDRPDLAGRHRILEVHTKGKPLGPSVDLDVLAKRTPGFTGADLANLLNEAAILTARRNLRQIGMRECEEAIDRVLAGPERKMLVMSEQDKLVTAYHEAGHAIVGHVLEHADPIHKVSIVARSRSLGLTYTLPEDRYNHSRSQLRDSMAMCLGGRSAEEIVFDEITTGAENDIEKVTRIARAMVTEYGMSELIGPQQLGQAEGDVLVSREMYRRPDCSPQVAALVDREVRDLIDEAHRRAREVLVRCRGVLDRLAHELVEKETLDALDLANILGGTAAPAPDDPAEPVPPRQAPTGATHQAPTEPAPALDRRQAPARSRRQAPVAAVRRTPAQARRQGQAETAKVAQPGEAPPTPASRRRRPTPGSTPAEEAPAVRPRRPRPKASEQ